MKNNNNSKKRFEHSIVLVLGVFSFLLGYIPILSEGKG
jgi:hypothetical protein